MFIQKRGQESIGMSFSMIFSIILIIALVGVAFIAIKYFLGISKCSDVGFYYDDLQKEITQAWNSDQYSDYFNESLPSDIELVCFGNYTASPLDIPSGDIQDELRNEGVGSESSNLFFYPPEKACDGSLESNVLKNVQIDRFFCVSGSDSGDFAVRLDKVSRGNSLVKVIR